MITLPLYKATNIDAISITKSLQNVYFTSILSHKYWSCLNHKTTAKCLGTLPCSDLQIIASSRTGSGTSKPLLMVNKPKKGTPCYTKCNLILPLYWIEIKFKGKKWYSKNKSKRIQGSKGSKHYWLKCQKNGNNILERPRPRTAFVAA